MMEGTSAVKPDADVLEELHSPRCCRPGRVVYGTEDVRTRVGPRRYYGTLGKGPKVFIGMAGPRICAPEFRTALLFTPISDDKLVSYCIPQNLPHSPALNHRAGL